MGHLMFHKQLPRILPETAATSKLQIAIPSGICVKVGLEKKKLFFPGVKLDISIFFKDSVPYFPEKWDSASVWEPHFLHSLSLNFIVKCLGSGSMDLVL